MPKFLFHVNYIGDGIKALAKEGGTKRKAAADKAVKSLEAASPPAPPPPMEDGLGSADALPKAIPPS